MFFRKSPEKFWNLIASMYSASPIDDLPAYKVKIQKLKTHLKPKDNVLDIGCGTGTQNKWAQNTLLSNIRESCALISLVVNCKGIFH